MNANIAKPTVIVISNKLWSMKQGIRQHATASPMMSHVDPSHIELYLVPSNFSITNKLCIGCLYRLRKITTNIYFAKCVMFILNLFRSVMHIVVRMARSFQIACL